MLTFNDLYACTQVGNNLTADYCRNLVSFYKDALTLFLTFFGAIAASYYGYMRFVHGRLYSEQLTPEVELNVAKSESHHWLIAKCTLKNNGLRRIRLRHRKFFLQYFAVFPSEDSVSITKDGQILCKHHERPIRTVRVFENETLLDPNEITTDAKVTLMSGLKIQGYRVTFRISEEKDHRTMITRSDASWETDSFYFFKDEEEKHVRKHPIRRTSEGHPSKNSRKRKYNKSAARRGR